MKTDEEIVKEIADGLTQALPAKLDKYGIGVSGALKGSFRHTTTTGDDGHLQKISVSYLISGKYRDMGVGKGVTLGEAVKGKRARGRASITKTFRHYELLMGEEFLKKYAGQGMDIALQSIPQVIELD